MKTYLLIAGLALCACARSKDDTKTPTGTSHEAPPDAPDLGGAGDGAGTDGSNSPAGGCSALGQACGFFNFCCAGLQCGAGGTCAVGLVTTDGGSGAADAGGPLPPFSRVRGNGTLLPLGTGPIHGLAVMVRDATGKPISGATVDWAITAGYGLLQENGMSLTSGTTDPFGESAVTFRGTFVPINHTTQQATVTASYGGASVAFFVTTYDAGIMFPVPPAVSLLTPSDLGILHPGQLSTGAVQVKIVNQYGPDLSQPIAKVGLRLTNGDDPTQPPGAWCEGDEHTVLSDAGGVVTCDLRAGAQSGVHHLRPRIGETIELAPLTLVIN